MPTAAKVDSEIKQKVLFRSKEIRASPSILHYRKITANKTKGCNESESKLKKKKFFARTRYLYATPYKKQEKHNVSYVSYSNRNQVVFIFFEMFVLYFHLCLSLSLYPTFPIYI